MTWNITDFDLSFLATKYQTYMSQHFSNKIVFVGCQYNYIVPHIIYLQVDLSRVRCCMRHLKYALRIIFVWYGLRKVIQLFEFLMAVFGLIVEDNISHNQVIVEIYVASIAQHQIFYIVVNKRQQVLSCHFV